MSYINTITNQYPVTEQEIRNEYSATSFSDPFIPPDEYLYVFPYPRPDVTFIQNSREIAPELTSEGHWEQRWEIYELSPDVIASKTQSFQNSMWDAIKFERDRRLQESGYKVQVGGLDKWFHSDTFSRSQQIGLVMLGANIPPNTMWKTMDGTFVEMTQTLANQIFGAAVLSDISIFGHAEQLKSSMLAASDPGTIDITGWPLGYGE